MLTNDPYKLPHWLFKPKQKLASTSTTVAAFSPLSGVKSNKGLQGLMLPTPDDEKNNKVTLLINNSTLAHELAHYAVFSAKVIERLLTDGCTPKASLADEVIDFSKPLVEKPPELGFKIYIIQNDKAVLLESTEKMSQGDFIDDEGKAKTRLVELTQIPAADIVVLDFKKMHELRMQFYQEDITYTIPQLIMDQWTATHTLPEGQGLPAIHITDRMKAALGVEGMQALYGSNFTFITYNDNIGLHQAPHDKIETLNWDDQLAKPVVKSMPALKHAKFSSMEHEHLATARDILRSSQVLESVTLTGTLINNVTTPMIFMPELEVIKAGAHANALTLNLFQLTKEKQESIFSSATFSNVTLRKSCFASKSDIVGIITGNTHIKTLSLDENTYETQISDLSAISAEHLENVYLHSQADTKEWAPLFKSLRNVKNLKFVWSAGVDQAFLNHADMPNITHLDISGSEMGEKTLEAALRLSSHIEVLNVDSVKVWGNVCINPKEYALHKVKRFSATHTQDNALGIKSEVIGKILENMHLIEDIDLSATFSNAQAFDFEWRGHSMKQLKSLSLKNRYYDVKLVARIITHAKGLRALDLSTEDRRVVSLSFFSYSSVSLDNLEYLNLSGNTIESHILVNILKKATRLKKLDLSKCTITGDADFSEASHSIIDIDMNDAVIDSGRFALLLTNLHLLSANLNMMRAIGKASPESMLEEIGDTRELISLEASENKTILFQVLYAKLTSARRITIDRPPILNKNWTLSNPMISEVSWHEKEISEDALYNFIQQLPNLKILNIGKKVMSTTTGALLNRQKLVKFIEKSPFIFKEQVIASFLTYSEIKIRELGRISIEPQNTNSGTPEHGVIYDGDDTSHDINIEPIGSQGPFQLKPQFTLIEGPELPISNVRGHVYYPDFESKDSTVAVKMIPHALQPYTITPCTRTHFSVYRKPAFDATFNKPVPALGLMQPWIELKDLSPNDQILALNTSADAAVQLSRCDVYDKYFLVLKPGCKQPSAITVEYDLTPEFMPAHRLPEDIKVIIRPFFAKFVRDASAEYSKLSLKDKLTHIFQHPQHHACEARTHGFIYKLQNTQLHGHAPLCRVANSTKHAWAELKYKGISYSVDLGGSPTNLKYEADNNERSSSAQLSVNDSNDDNDNNIVNNNNNNNNTTISVTQSPYQTSAIAPSQGITRLKELVPHLNQKTPNENILIVCRYDAENKQLKSVRRFLRTLSSNHVMVDTYDQALSSDPYIQLNRTNETWDRIETTGAAGWMNNQVKEKMGKNSRIIVDWSSISKSGSTKMNACIDLSHRMIDGVSIHENIQVIGLIHDNDPRLSDSSFLSRHSGRVYRINHREEPSTELMKEDGILPIELYHSTQWQTLIMGMLGFNDTGNPIHKPEDLLMSTSRKHLVINNPPEDCEDFDRFIHDLEDGNEFKYCDISIKLPRMKVTLTEGYPFDKLKHAVMTVNSNISADMLHDIHIDHVLTPSTFERCLQTRSINGTKLIPAPGWLAAARTEKPMSLYITKTLSEQQYCYLLKTTPAQSLHLYCAPGVALPKELRELPLNENRSKPQIKSTVARTACSFPTIIDVSELSADDLLYRHDYDHDKENKRFIFSEKVSAVWHKLENGEDIILTGHFSDELMDHLATLLLPNPYLWHDGKKKTFEGKLILQPSDPAAPRPHLRKSLRISNEASRKPALLNSLAVHPIVFIEGKPGIGKSCFIRAMKADPTLNCYSFDPHDNTSLKAWAASNDARPTILFIDENDKLGTEFTMFKGRLNPKREILIDGDIYALKDNHYIVPIGNHTKHTPAILDAKTPVLIFETLSKDYVINTILTPIFAEVDKDTAKSKATAHYNAKKTVREMQAEAIIKNSFKIPLSRVRVGEGGERSETGEGHRRQPYHLTPHRKPLFNAILDSLRARQFSQQATADSAKYGGKTGHMLEGLPGIGKSDIIHAAMLAAKYEEITDLNQLYDKNADHRFRYYRIASTCSIKNLSKHLKQAFDQGCIVHIDELDALLKADTPEKEGEILRLVADINAYLMGEDTQHNRPTKPGFMLLGTGNGIAYDGRARLDASMNSRMHMHKVEPYDKEDCEWIISQKYLMMGKNTYTDAYIHKHISDPRLYTFRDLMTDVKRYMEFLPKTGHTRPSASTGNMFVNAYHPLSKKITPAVNGSKSAHTVTFGSS